MIENAQQGFYNGSPVALGYKAVEVEKRGIRIKKKLAIDPLEAETVRLIGDGTSGPLGVKKAVSWLNERGYRTRLGARFGVATIHGILTNAIYIGDSIFNKRDSRTLKQKPVKERCDRGAGDHFEGGLLRRLRRTSGYVTPERRLQGS